MQEGGANENESAAIEEKEEAAVLPPPPAAAAAAIAIAAAAAAAPPPPPPPPLLLAEAPPSEAPPLPVETVEAAPEAAAAAAAEAPEAETEAAVEAEEDSVTSEESEAATMVKIVGSLTEFRTELADAGDKLIVVDFSATWCGPCKMIKPFFHSMVEKYPDVIFIEIDVDDAQDVASHCDVKCMPTFQFYKNNEKVHEFSGANKEKLEEAIKKHM